MLASSSASPITPSQILLAGERGLFKLGEGIAVHVDHVVEEAHRLSRDLIEPVPVHVAVGGEVGEIDRAKAARLVRQQRHLPVGVGGFEATLDREGVGPVDGIEEQQSWVAALVGVLADAPQQLGGIHAACGAVGAWLDQSMRPASFHRMHKRVPNADGEVEVVEAAGAFGRDELVDVGVGDVEDGHAGRAAPAALAEHFGRGVEYLEE